MNGLFFWFPTLFIELKFILSHFFQANQRSFFLPLLLRGAGGEETDGIVCKRKAERSHISFSFVANRMPRFWLEVCSATQAQRQTRKGEASVEGSVINCHGLIQQPNVGAITLWQLFYFSLTEFQTCPVHWDSFHLVKTCAVFKLPSDPWSWREGKKPNIAHSTLKWC